MVDPYAPTDDWREGYEDGYSSGFRDATKAAQQTIYREGLTMSSLYPGTGNPHPRRRLNPKYKRAGPMEPKRRKTKYQTAYAAAYKRLKKKHPRMAFGSLSKKAHAAARKKVK